MPSALYPARLRVVCTRQLAVTLSAAAKDWRAPKCPSERDEGTMCGEFLRVLERARASYISAAESSGWVRKAQCKVCRDALFA